MNKSEEHSINFIAHLHRATKPITLENCAYEINCPLPFLTQIALKLRRAGIVKSIRGPGGGYTLAKAPSFYEIRKCFKPVKKERKGQAKQIEILINDFLQSLPVTQSGVEIA